MEGTGGTWNVSHIGFRIETQNKPSRIDMKGPGGLALHDVAPDLIDH